MPQKLPDSQNFDEYLIVSVCLDVMGFPFIGDTFPSTILSQRIIGQRS